MEAQVGRAEAPSDGALAFRDDVHGMMFSGDHRIRLVGPRSAAVPHLETFAEHPQRRTWNMQWSMGPKAVQDLPRVNEVARAFGTDMRVVLPLQALRRTPLNIHLRSPLRIANVPYPLLVIDDRAFLSGPLGTPLADTFWSVEDAELVERAARVFLAAWDAGTTVDDNDLPPRLPERRLEVALRLVDGFSDREIAADLGVSERTVSAEVSRIVSWVGARSRGHAVALLVGAG